MGGEGAVCLLRAGGRSARPPAHRCAVPLRACCQSARVARRQSAGAASGAIRRVRRQTQAIGGKVHSKLRQGQVKAICPCSHPLSAQPRVILGSNSCWMASSFVSLRWTSGLSRWHPCLRWPTSSPSCQTPNPVRDTRRRPVRSPHSGQPAAAAPSIVTHRDRGPAGADAGVGTHSAPPSLANSAPTTATTQSPSGRACP